MLYIRDFGLHLKHLILFLAFLSCDGPPPRANFNTVDPPGRYTVKLEKGFGGWRMIVEINGSVANVSPSTLSAYELVVNYASYNEKGEVYLLKSEIDHYTATYFEDGFGGGFAKRTPSWTPKEIKSFKFSDRISVEDSLYPTSQIFALVSIRASDPFGNKVNEPIAKADITEQWHQVQSKLRDKLELRKK